MYIQAIIIFFYVGIVNVITPTNNKEPKNVTFWKGVIIISSVETFVVLILLNLLGEFRILMGVFMAVAMAMINANIFEPLCIPSKTEEHEHSRVKTGHLIYNIIAFCILFLILYFI